MNIWFRKPKKKDILPHFVMDKEIGIVIGNGFSIKEMDHVTSKYERKKKKKKKMKKTTVKEKKGKKW